MYRILVEKCNDIISISKKYKIKLVITYIIIITNHFVTDFKN